MRLTLLVAVAQVQIRLAQERISQLQGDSYQKGEHSRSEAPSQEVHKSICHPILALTSKQDKTSPSRMIGLLKDYVDHLQATDTPSHATGERDARTYYMPTDTVSAEDWSEFENVFQVHSPQITIDNAIRDVSIKTLLD
jgi:hypothetical protein